MTFLKSFIKEFQEFAMRGNAIDLSIGVVLGSSFDQIITSFVQDLLMPSLGFFLGAINLTSIQISIGNSIIRVGNFLQNLLDFMLVAFAIFLLIKAINRFHKKILTKNIPEATIK